MNCVRVKQDILLKKIVGPETFTLHLNVVI